jgi:predicted component of type VI protein secretion system
MKDKETFEELFQILKSSQNEEEVISNLKSILKHCSIDEYKHSILENPYFKSVLPDVRDSVCTDIDLIREALNKEIKEIDSELGKIIKKVEFSEQIQKLKELKRDCISLIYEIDERKKDLNSLI